MKIGRRPSIGACALGFMLALAPSIGQAAPHRDGPGDPEAHMERMIQRLDLDAAQGEALRSALERHHEAMREGNAGIRAAREALEERIHAPTMDEAGIRAAAADLATLEADRAVARAGLLQELRSILTPEQMEQFEGLHERRRAAMREGFAGPGAHRGRHRPGHRR